MSHIASAMHVRRSVNALLTFVLVTFALVACHTSTVVAAVPTSAATASASAVTRSNSTDCSGKNSIPLYTATQQSNTLAFLEALREALPPLQSKWQCGNFCAWDGVRCSEGGVEIALDSTKLYGSLPEVPSSVDPDEVVLTSVELYGEGHSLSGGMPWSWIFIPSLTSLKLRGVGLSGSPTATLAAPPRIAHMRNVDRALGSPVSFATSTTRKSSNIAVIDAANSNMGGTIPEIYASYFPKAYAFYLNGNNFVGTLPPAWGSLTALGILHLFNNSLTGSIPAEWANMANISDLRLEQNKLCGCVPEEMQALEAGVPGRKTLTLTTDAYIRSDECATTYSCDQSSSSSSSSSVPSSSSSSSSSSVPSSSSSSSSSVPSSSSSSSSSVPSSSSSSSSSVPSSSSSSSSSVPSSSSSSSSSVPSSSSSSSSSVPSSSSSSSSVDECFAPITMYTAAEQAATRDFLLAFNAAFTLGWNETCTNFCSWQYVDCTIAGVELNMGGAPVSGELPDLASSVVAANVVLNKVDVSYTGAYGTFPASWGSLPSMRNITASHTAVGDLLPSEWSTMTSLQYFDASSSFLSGQLPDSWGTMTNLKVLRLSDNSVIQGTLPESWSGMTSLQELYLSNTGVAGTLPATWATMTQMQKFAVNDNSLIGTVPEGYSSWASLSNAALQNNNFCGCLPSDWIQRRDVSLTVTGDAPLLAEDCATANTCNFSLSSSSSHSSSSSSSSVPSSSSSSSSVPSSSSSSSSSVPSSSSSSSSVPSSSSSSSSSVPSSSSSSSSSSVPSSSSSSSSSGLCNAPVTLYTTSEVENTHKFLTAIAASFPELTPLWVCPNFCIWEGVSCTSSGVAVELSGMTLTGTLPPIPSDCVGSEVVVSNLDLGGAGTAVTVSGSLPNNWSGLSHLLHLDLSHTGVTGTLPTGWSVMNLQTLNLGYNNLNGSIPAVWGDMASLAELYLNNNQLTGSLPLEILFAESITILDVSNNQLSGGLPSIKGGKRNLRVFGADLQRKARN